MDEEQRKIYATICKHNDIKARDKAQEIGADRSDAEIPVCSGDMLFNLFDEFIGFLG